MTILYAALGFTAFMQFALLSLSCNAQTVSCGHPLSSSANVLGVDALSNDSLMGTECSCMGDTTGTPATGCYEIKGLYANGRCKPGDADGTLGCHYGIRYQCVEFVRRFYSMRSDTVNRIDTSLWPSITYARDFLKKDGTSPILAPQLTPVLNKGTDLPSVGDLIVFDGPDDGHVAIVSSNVINGQFQIVEQNFGKGSSGTSTLTITNHIVGNHPTGADPSKLSAYSVIGWLHQNTQPGSSNPPPPPLNPTPSIQSLSPSSVLILFSGNVSITGSGFIPASTLSYNNLPHAVTYVNANTLNIPVFSSDDIGLGNYPVVISNPPPGGGPSGTAYLEVTSTPISPTGQAPAISTLVTDTSPTDEGSFDLHIGGSNFQTANVQVYVMGGPYCTTTTSCVIANGSLSSVTPSSFIAPATINTSGDFYVYARNGGGGLSSSGWHLYVNPPAIIYSITTSVNPPKSSTPFSLYIQGDNIDTTNVQVYVIGGHCTQSTSCVIRHQDITGITSKTLTVPVTLNDPGVFTIYVQNNPKAIPSNGGLVTVSP